MEPSFILEIFMNGLSLSCTYALMAIGLTLVFGVLRVFNFAQGELIMVGAYIVWLLFATTGVPVFVALLGGALAVGGLALAIERGLFRPARGDPFRALLLSIGLVYVLQVSARLTFGALDKTLPIAIPGRVEIWGTFLSIQRLVIIPAVVSVTAGVWFFLERTKFGRAVRACIQDRGAAALQGMSQDRVRTIVMLIAGALAGLAGGIISLGAAIGPYLGHTVILKAFIVVIVGGMGSVGGTAIASLIFGFLDSTVASLIDLRITNLVDVVVLLVFLILRPRGLFGRE